jgi:hypothetical protein
MTFDPYHEWLGIPPSEQPPNHYRLLGIAPFESSPDVISQAAGQRMEQIRVVQTGPSADLGQKILNEIAGAKLCLLDPDIKRAYDADLAKRTPPPLPPQTAGLPAPSRTVRRRRRPSLIGLVLAGVGLAMATGVGAMVLWLLNAHSQQTRPKDQADSRAGANSQDKASSPSANTAPTTKTEPPTAPTAVSPPVVTPPAVAESPAAKADSPTTVPIPKSKGKKKAAKKLEKPRPKWKTNIAGYPSLAGTWSGADGQSITVVQQRDQFTATGVLTDANHTGVLWRWRGTVDHEGHLNGRLVYTQARSRFVDRDASATMSPDGRTIAGNSGAQAGVPGFPWTKTKGKPPSKSK